MTDTEAKSFYINGLSNDIQMLVRSRAPATLREAMAQALALSVRNNPNSLYVNYVKQINRPKNKNTNAYNYNKSCFNCGKAGHLAKNCRAPRKN